jgi:hypothetical protein
MKLDTDPFLVNVIDFEEKKVLVRSDKATTTEGENVIVSDELRSQMIKPRSPEVGVWKENIWQRPARRAKPMSAMLIKKYKRQQELRRRGNA